ncbi:MAG: hypothetical protein K9M10_00415 [Candidatus Pacebacteria bacterium]|nr:hypothetical protein [Candidatus Paceibacterota bacterium]MCF7856925.1 hypothetical protein [Candidatus Paceibacterota bacterium]
MQPWTFEESVPWQGGFATEYSICYGWVLIVSFDKKRHQFSHEVLVASVLCKSRTQIDPSVPHVLLLGPRARISMSGGTEIPNNAVYSEVVEYVHSHDSNYWRERVCGLTTVIDIAMKDI